MSAQVDEGPLTLRTRGKIAGRWPVVLAMLAVLLVTAAGFWYLAPARTGSMGGWLGEACWRFFDECYRRSLLDPWLVAGIAVIACLERRWPADRSQKTFSIGLAHDFVWVILDGVLRVGIVMAYVDFLCAIYDRFLPSLTVHALGQMPAAIRIAWVIVLSDFLGWWQHWLQHKVTWFWYFHAVHHAQREVNVFTTMRSHVVELLIGQSATTFAFKMLAVNTPTIGVVTAVMVWLGRLHHSNLRMNFGPLRYIFVTPQSHRIHHSIEPRHHDTNFAPYFCIWDRLFGTHFDGADEYPATGIKDGDFPVEHTVRGWSLIRTPMLQLVYPFVRVGRDLKDWFRRSSAVDRDEPRLRQAA